ncbi:lipopolysaccharide biosynthesis protein [Virgibacillus salinus]|uniref:lipopolysaccharide biosynthesis protein n=1 Tax=Virgibacillus salinus TaxID=553311 RepID=UPI0015880DF2|nr:oligosaccharide flippase family protein [Virgibacillus salinus]
MKSLLNRLGTNSKGTIIVFSGKIFNALFMYTTLAIIARVLPVSLFGTFTFFTSLVAFSIIVAKFGIETVTLASIPKIKDKVKYQNTISKLFLLLLITSSIVVTVLLISRSYIDKILNIPMYKEVLLIVVWTIPLIAFITFFRSWNQSLLKFGNAIIPENFIRPFAFFIFAVFIYLAGLDSIYYVIIAYVISYFIAFFIAFCVRRELMSIIRSNKLKLTVSDFNNSLQFTLVQLLNQSVKFSPVLVLGFYLTATEVGIFRISQQTTILAAFLLTSINMVFAPTISLLYNEDRIQEFSDFYIITTKWTLIIGSYISMIILLNSDFLMGVFGKNFQEWGVLLQILAIAQFINASTGSSGHILLMTGRQKLMIKLSLLQALLTVIASIILVQIYGLIGAIIAVASGVILLNCLQILFVWRIFSFHPYNNYYFRVLISAFVVYIIGFSVKEVINISFLPYFVFSVVLITILYSVIMPLIALNGDEKHFLKKVFGMKEPSKN